MSQYCSENNYKLVWFVEKIEVVILGEKIPKRDKVKKADELIKKHLTQAIHGTLEVVDPYSSATSNLYDIFDKLPLKIK